MLEALSKSHVVGLEGMQKMVDIHRKSIPIINLGEQMLKEISFDTEFEAGRLAGLNGKEIGAEISAQRSNWLENRRENEKFNRNSSLCSSTNQR